MGKTKRKKMVNAQIFECIQCSKKGNRQTMMEHFVRAHVTLDRVPWSCSKCGFRAPSKQALHRHEGHFIHKSAEKTHPGVPTAYIKSQNPYVVRVGQDIVPVNESTVKGLNDDGQEVSKRKFVESGTSKRRWSDMEDSDREAGFQDYDTRDSPVIPAYDAYDERRVQAYNHDKRLRTQDQSGRSRSSDPDQLLFLQADVHIPHTDHTHKELIMPDQYIKPILMADQEHSIVPTACPRVKCGTDGEPNIGHCAWSTSSNQSDFQISNARIRNLSGQNEQIQTDNNRRDMVDRNLHLEGWELQATEPDRVVASSSITEKCSLESSTFSECRVRGRVCKTPHSDGTSDPGRQNGTRTPCRIVDQSAEVGSSCFGIRGKPVATTSYGMTEEPGEITASDFSARVGEESDEDQDEVDPQCQDDDLSDSRMLEEKVNDLVAALEPLKNISKALIALDHHMRRLLPLVENLTKDNFKKQE